MIPIVFVHGFMGGSRQWQGQTNVFAGHEVIALDLPGFGEHAHLDALDTIDAYAKWALDELSMRGIDQFHLVGHSMGGMIVQDMISRAPERVLQLVLYGTGATGVLPGRFETIETSKNRARADGARTTARRIAATWFLDQEQAPAFYDCALIAENCTSETIFAGLDAMQRWDGVERLANIKSKTLVIWGDCDRTYPWQQAEQLWRAISSANLAVVPGCAHAVHLEKSELFNSLLQDFFVSG